MSSRAALDAEMLPVMRRKLSRGSHEKRREELADIMNARGPATGYSEETL